MFFDFKSSCNLSDLKDNFYSCITFKNYVKMIITFKGRSDEYQMDISIFSAYFN